MRLADGAVMTAKEFPSRAALRPDGRRHELVGGEPVAMAAEKNRHHLVKTACIELEVSACFATLSRGSQPTR